MLIRPVTSACGVPADLRPDAWWAPAASYIASGFSTLLLAIFVVILIGEGAQLVSVGLAAFIALLGGLWTYVGCTKLVRAAKMSE